MDSELRFTLRSKLEETLWALKTALKDGRSESFLLVEAGLKTALALLREESGADLETSELTGFRIAYGESRRGQVSS